MHHSEDTIAERSFQDLLNLRHDAGPDGEACTVLAIEAMHLNAGRVLHGGVAMTMLDVAMANACRARDTLGRRAVTVEMKTSFLRPGGMAGDRVAASGLVRHVTQSMAFCDGELRDMAGTLLATASGTFRYVNPGLPIGTTTAG
ncbi:MAG TPA: PaaI family thioesterase [Paraburkholderia sp.]|uniref:PaaI family thioesterase n=1 Tax=Paraburkholderia sp. TaxID=1926495 RepID=UPI002B4841F4|nr:PaaI family thioesterase [Paraburkholderia sp.]HKR47775.1 PaaI family thioesterase [Paraburkholderia sp.]